MFEFGFEFGFESGFEFGFEFESGFESGFEFEFDFEFGFFCADLGIEAFEGVIEIIVFKEIFNHVINPSIVFLCFHFEIL